jgi:hypothetical protein
MLVQSVAWNKLHMQWKVKSRKVNSRSGGYLSEKACHAGPAHLFLLCPQVFSKKSLQYMKNVNVYKRRVKTFALCSSTTEQYERCVCLNDFSHVEMDDFGCPLFGHSYQRSIS